MVIALTTDNSSSGGLTFTVSNTVTARTWTAIMQRDGSNKAGTDTFGAGGYAALFWAYNPTALTNITVTASTGAGAIGGAMKVYVLTGVDGTTPVATFGGKSWSAAASTGGLALTNGTRAGGLYLSAATDWNQSGAPTSSDLSPIYTANVAGVVSAGSGTRAATAASTSYTGTFTFGGVAQGQQVAAIFQPTGGAPSVTVNVDVSGSGTLSATVTPLSTVSASLTGAGTLSATVTPRAAANVSVSGSGALTATAVHVVAAALSATGTLVADFGAVTVSGNLTGSGTLTAKVASIAVNPALTGTGTLTATVVVPAYAVALSGSGDLTAVVVPKLTITCAFTGDGILRAVTTRAVFAWVLHTPTQEVGVRMAGRGLVAVYDQGLSIYRVAGEWRVRLTPGPNELANADRYYQGGYRYVLSDAERAELIAGGFADNIIQEEVKA
jgi:hypothetical protein